MEINNAILKEFGNSCFAILAHDSSTKEQMAIVLRYVEKQARVIEHFLGSYTLQISMM